MSFEIMGSFREKEWNVQDWSAYSPDLNPIENNRAILKQPLPKQNFFCENLEKNVRNLDQTWRIRRQELVWKL